MFSFTSFTHVQDQIILETLHSAAECNTTNHSLYNYYTIQNLSDKIDGTR